MKFLRPLLILFMVAIVYNIPVQCQQKSDYLAFAQVMPKPVGGLASIYKNITYPQTARDAHLEGKVYLLVYVNTNGGVDNVTVLKGLGLGCDKAAMAAVKKENFTPAMNNGKKVKVKLAMAIKFKLDD